MAKTLSQEQFRDFLTDNITAIKALQHELDEIQSGFTTNFVDFKARHDATLIRLTEEVIPLRNQLSPELQQRINQQIEQKRQEAQQRRSELKKQIPRMQIAVDTLLEKAQKQLATIQQQNPQYDAREEALKADVERLRSEIATYNNRIKELNKGLGFLFNFGKIDTVDKERQQLVGEFKTQQLALHKVRQEWDERLQKVEQQQENYQGEWQKKNLELAEMRAEQELLADDARLEQLALKRAVFAVLDDLKDPALCEGGGMEQKLREMLVLNHQTDNYMEGLRAVGGIIAWLGSVMQGMESMKKSIDAMIAQQKQHSAHLKPLKIEVPDEAFAFQQAWGPLREKVTDDGRLCKIPLEFVDAIQPAMKTTLTEETISSVFDGLGNALKRAAKAWG